MQWSWKLGLGALLAVQTASVGFAASFSEVKLIASDAAEGDRLGYSIAVAGNTLVVGSVNAGNAAGSAYVFQRDASGGSDWIEVKKLNASDAAEGDRFGHSVAIHGDTIVVGAHATAGAGPDSGSAYIFERHWEGDDNWGQWKKLNASRFGQSVAIDADTIVVGADGDTDLGDDSGSAYIFERHWEGDDNWGQRKKINASDQTKFDHFGWSVAIDGERVVIGMYGDDDPFHKSGSAYIFERDFGDRDNWGEVKKIQALDPGDLEYFGRSVSVSADRAVVDSHPGSAYVFELSEGGAGNWGQLAELIASDVFDCAVLGGGVSISGSTIAVGARCDSSAGYKAGAVYVYEPVTTSLPTLPVSGLTLLGALILLSGVGAHRAVAGRHSPAGSRDAEGVGRLIRQGTTSRPQ